MSNRDTLLDYLKQNNGKLDSETWEEVGMRFGIVGKSPGDIARKLWGRYLAKEEKIDNMVIKSRWQVQTKGGGTQWLESYTSNLSSDNIKDFRNELVAEMKTYSPMGVTTKNTSGTGSRLLEISIPDLHIGREPLEKTKEKFFLTLKEIVTKATRFDSNIYNVVFVIGNDWFNSDNTSYSTRRGTPQFDYLEWKESFRAGRDIAISAIEYLKEEFDSVNVLIVPGNHDPSKIFYLGDVLEAYYSQDSIVKVDNSTARFKHFVWGYNFIMYDHGEIKPFEYPLIMATEFPLQWSQATYKEVHTGHFHHEMVKDYRGVKVRFFPSIASHSEWEKERGFGGNREALGIVWDLEGGMAAILPVLLNDK